MTFTIARVYSIFRTISKLHSPEFRSQNGFIFAVPDALRNIRNNGGQKPGIKTATQGDGMQAYALFPNPNDGNLVLVQKVADTALVTVDVADVLGRSVYKQQVRFMEKNHRLNLQNIAPGMYVTTVIDANGRKYTFKFVKQ